MLSKKNVLMMLITQLFMISCNLYAMSKSTKLFSLSDAIKKQDLSLVKTLLITQTPDINCLLSLIAHVHDNEELITLVLKNMPKSVLKKSISIDKLWKIDIPHREISTYLFGIDKATPVELAIAYSNIAVFKQFVGQGANLNQKNSYGNNLIYLLFDSFLNLPSSTVNARIEILTILLQNKVNPNEKNNDGKTSLDRIIDCFKQYKSDGNSSEKPNDFRCKALELFFKFGVDPTILNYRKKIPIFEMISNHNTAALKLFLKLKPSLLFLKDDEKNTLLHNCTGEMAKVILEQPNSKQLINTKNNDGQTPLHRCKDTIAAQLLLDYNANINAKDKKGNTLLHVIVGSYHCCHFFFCNSRCYYGNVNNFYDIFDLLLKNKDINPNIKNLINKRPIDEAITKIARDFALIQENVLIEPLENTKMLIKKFLNNKLICKRNCLKFFLDGYKEYPYQHYLEISRNFYSRAGTVCFLVNNKSDSQYKITPHDVLMHGGNYYNKIFDDCICANCVSMQIQLHKKCHDHQFTDLIISFP